MMVQFLIKFTNNSIQKYKRGLCVGFILKKEGILPGFGLSLGFTVIYLSLFVLIPLGGLVVQVSGMGWEKFWAAVTGARVVAAYGTSFSTALIASLISFVLGTIIAWTLVRYEFPWKWLLDVLVDIPFALPTAVAGISLATLFAPSGWLGEPLAKLGLAFINNTAGIVIALVFIGFPFVVRTVQPVLQEFAKEYEEAAHSLGASRLQTFARVILPAILPAMLTGFTLSFARSLGEYGSVIFIAGNIPKKTEIVSLLIMAKLDQFDYAGASAIALVMLGLSLVMLLALNFMQRLGKHNRLR